MHVECKTKIHDIFFENKLSLKKLSDLATLILRRFRLFLKSIFSQKIKQHLAMLAIQNQKVLRRKKRRCDAKDVSKSRTKTYAENAKKTTYLRKQAENSSERAFADLILEVCYALFEIHWKNNSELFF